MFCLIPDAGCVSLPVSDCTGNGLYLGCSFNAARKACTIKPQCVSNELRCAWKSLTLEAATRMMPGCLSPGGDEAVCDAQRARAYAALDIDIACDGASTPPPYANLVPSSDQEDGDAAGRTFALELFVDPVHGVDDAAVAGTNRAEAFASLEYALARSRANTALAKQPKRIWLLAGKHRVLDTIDLTSRDSMLTIEGERGAVLSGSVLLPNTLEWKPSAAASAGVFVATLPSRIMRQLGSLSTLYADGEPMVRARFPNIAKFGQRTYANAGLSKWRTKQLNQAARTNRKQIRIVSGRYGHFYSAQGGRYTGQFTPDIGYFNEPTNEAQGGCEYSIPGGVTVGAGLAQQIGASTWAAEPQSVYFHTKHPYAWSIWTFDVSRKGSASGVASNPLPTLAAAGDMDLANLRAWQAFYIQAGGDAWKQCGGSEGFFNPCQVCRSSGSSSTARVVCQKHAQSGKQVITEIVLRNNRVRGSVSAPALQTMGSLTLFDVSNSLLVQDQVYDNRLTGDGACLSVDRCMRDRAQCSAAQTGLALCTFQPTMAPTKQPTKDPTMRPTKSPTHTPTRRPSKSPTAPTLPVPTASPVVPTTRAPTKKPTVRKPTKKPTTAKPTRPTTVGPTQVNSGEDNNNNSTATIAPTTSLKPTRKPTKAPTRKPTKRTKVPTVKPTRKPTKTPTRKRTKAPTAKPTKRSAAAAAGSSLLAELRASEDDMEEDDSHSLRHGRELQSKPVEVALNLVRGGFQEARGDCGTGGGTDWYVEGAKSLLDNAGEFVLDTQAGQLYFIPPASATTTTADDLNNMVLEMSSQRVLLRARGTTDLTVRSVHFEHTYATHMDEDTHEVPSGGDWTLTRQAALVLENDVARALVKHCTFRNLGGNGLLVSNNAVDVEISRNDFHTLGSSAVLLVGDPLFASSTAHDRRLNAHPNNHVDRVLVRENVMSEMGLVVKQSSGIFLALAKSVLMERNVIFDCSRAGITFNDGFGGNHTVSKNVVFHTVLETEDHGPLNVWDRQNWLEPADKLPLQILDNLFYGNTMGPKGIDLDDGVRNWIVLRNVVFDGLLKIKGSSIVLEDNLVYPISIGCYLMTPLNDLAGASNITLTRNTCLSRNSARPYDFNMDNAESAAMCLTKHFKAMSNTFHGTRENWTGCGKSDILGLKSWQTKYGQDLGSVLYAHALPKAWAWRDWAANGDPLCAKFNSPPPPAPRAAESPIACAQRNNRF